MNALALLKETWSDFNEDRCPSMAASMSYATVFALPPLLMLCRWRQAGQHHYHASARTNSRHHGRGRRQSFGMILLIAFLLLISFVISALGHSSAGSAFGAAAALAILLIWIYYAALILFFGAEFTQTWARRHGRSIKPETGAVKAA